MALSSQRVKQLPNRFTEQNIGSKNETLRTINHLLLMVQALQRDVKALDQRLTTLENP